MKSMITAGLAVTGSALAVTASLGAPGANAVEPMLSWGTSFGGTSINHLTTAPAGAVFDGDIGTLTPAVAPGVLGVLATTAGGHCVSGQYAFYPKDGSSPEIVPVGTTCGLPVIYAVTAGRPAGVYAEVCAEITTDPYRTRTCLRFPND
ncbi:hypothetical protein ACFXHA_12365 [Nocardia sp. NPDC059240]|uniref:hypothetical protein n=1 Tax=Nocardia sp. NPDC059240 TaxID=3346786 RepID=UPI003682F6AA